MQEGLWRREESGGLGLNLQGLEASLGILVFILRSKRKH